MEYVWYGRQWALLKLHIYLMYFSKFIAKYKLKLKFVIIWIIFPNNKIWPPHATPPPPTRPRPRHAPQTVHTAMINLWCCSADISIHSFSSAVAPEVFPTWTRRCWSGTPIVSSSWPRPWPARRWYSPRPGRYPQVLLSSLPSIIHFLLLYFSCESPSNVVPIRPSVLAILVLDFLPCLIWLLCSLSARLQQFHFYRN